ncbi:MAG: hypothetical protein DDT27_01220 [Dehalococcoidia bacterium]|nr:hypothetical protein [Chloroflexota bacterium]
MPCILCGPGCLPAKTWEPSGSTAIAVKPGFLGLITPATPVIVPPVPTPETRISTLPSVSLQISSAVVRRCISGFAGFLNCWGMKHLGFSAANSSAFLIAPFIPSAPGVSTSSAPKADKSCLRSRDMVSGMVRISRYPRAAQTKARAMPVLPLVGSTITVSLLISPFSSASTIIDTPMRSFTLLMGLKDSSFATTSASNPSVMRFNLTSGVFPISSVESRAMPLVSLGISIPLYRSISTFWIISAILLSSFVLV